MWRCLRFIDNYKGKRPANIKDTYRILEKLKIGLIERVGEDIIEDVFIPAREFDTGDSEDAKNYLVGMIFIQYNEEHNSSILSVLYENNIRMTSIVRETDIIKMKTQAQLIVNTQAEKTKFSSGDNIQIISGDYKDMIGIVESVKGEDLDINIQIFGRDHLITLNNTMAIKIKN